jgi:hypothetical protein
MVPVKRLTRACGPRPAGVVAALLRLSADYVGLGSNCLFSVGSSRLPQTKPQKPLCGGFCGLVPVKRFELPTHALRISDSFCN